MRNRNHLRSFLAGESRAYGFTIAFWGSGAILVNSFGTPNFIEAVSYGAGAITGFGILALVAFRGISKDLDDGQGTALVLSSIHYLAALLPLIASQLIIEYVSSVSAAFFLSGLSVSVIYNSLSVLEEDIAEFIGNKLD